MIEYGLRFLLTGSRSPGLHTLGDTLRTTSFTPDAVLDRDGSGPRGWWLPQRRSGADRYGYEYLIMLGSAMTIIAVIGAASVRSLAAIFLAFRTIFPASATLIVEHVKQARRKHVSSGARRSNESAALAAEWAWSGSFVLASFGLVISLMIVSFPACALLLAAVLWVGVAMLACHVRRWL